MSQKIGKESIQRDLTRVISFTSGKGGVGKTHTVVNTAVSLVMEGFSVLVLDADLGLANIDVLAGVTPRGTLRDVLKGIKGIEEILTESPAGFTIIPAASGIEEIHALTGEERMFLLGEIERIAAHYDFLLIDTPAGIGSDVMYFNSAAGEIICIINGEPTSLTDAYALIKVLNTSYGEKSFGIVVNNVLSASEADTAYESLSNAVQRFLQIETRFVGWIQSDPVVRECIRDRKLVAFTYPSSKAARGVASVTRSLLECPPEERLKGGMQFFFQQLLGMSSYGEEAIS